MSPRQPNTSDASNTTVVTAHDLRQVLLHDRFERIGVACTDPADQRRIIKRDGHGPNMGVVTETCQARM